MGGGVFFACGARIHAQCTPRESWVSAGKWAGGNGHGAPVSLSAGGGAAKEGE